MTSVPAQIDARIVDVMHRLLEENRRDDLEWNVSNLLTGYRAEEVREWLQAHDVAVRPRASKGALIDEGVDLVVASGSWQEIRA